MEKTIEISIRQKHKFSVQDINDLIVTALEGGINYWCYKAQIKKNADDSFIGVAPEDQEKVVYASDVIGYGGILILWNSEPDDSGKATPIEYRKTWELNLASVVKGIKMHCTKRNIALKDLLDNHDADDADAIVQYAIFGEIVFG
jgi:hypothetical protein